MEGIKQMTDWTAYEKRVEASAPKMLRAMKTLAHRCHIRVLEVLTDDDYRISFPVARPNGTLLNVSFEIWDSGDTDDGIYGVHGNFIFNLVEEGGHVIGMCIPGNYTSGVWVDYTDSVEWERRLDAIIAGLDEAYKIIAEWRKEK
jgi:hypothetical protein